MSTSSNMLTMTQDEIRKLAAEKGLSAEELLALARSTFGSVGGRSGTGGSKRRSPEHYRKMQEERQKAMKAKREAQRKLRLELGIAEKIY